MLPTLKTHIWYLVLIAVGVFGFHVWLQEHDARVAAENAIKASEQQVKTLQTQIATTDTKTAQTVQQVRTVVVQAKTQAQIVQTIPQLTDVPLNVRSGPTPSTVVVDSTALLTVVSDLKIASVQLAGCQSNYAAEQAIVEQKDLQIAALKKKPKFWKRVKGDMELVATGIGIVGTLVVLHGGKL